jgi:hypothetical protein
MTYAGICAFAFSLLLIVAPAGGQNIHREDVKFKAGESSATIKGSIKGDQTVDYILGAKAGQKMTVTLKSGHASCYFNVTAPGQDAALFIGSTSGSQYEGVLPADGEYTVRLYLMRSAARRSEKASYTITFMVDGGKTPAGATIQSKDSLAK